MGGEKSRVMVKSNFKADQTPPAIARMFSPPVATARLGAATHIERRTSANAAAMPVPSTEIRRRLRQKLTHQLAEIDRSSRCSRRPAR
jgi:hypothetical protein